MAFIDFNDKNNKMLLMTAVQRGHLRIVSLLIEYGADVNFQDDRTISISNVHLSLDKSYYTVLMTACECGHSEIARVLIEHKADIKDDFRKALIMATFNKHVDTVKVLLNADAKFNESTKKGIINLAVNEGRADLISLLKTKKQENY